MQTRLVRIRSSMDADFPAYLALFTAYEEEIGLNPAGSREKLLRRVDREGAQDLHALLLAEETPAGFVHAHPEAQAGWIYSFYVAPAFRRRGLGRSLAAHGEAWLWTAGARAVLLTTEKAAAGFWKKAGYTPTGRMDPTDGAEIWQKGN